VSKKCYFVVMGYAGKIVY